MRTNREGNFIKFFSIDESAKVLMLSGEMPVSESGYDYIFWNPREVKETGEICVEKLISRLGKGGKLVIYFDNPHGVHAFATGQTEEMTTKVTFPWLCNQYKKLGQAKIPFVMQGYYAYPSVDFPSVIFTDAHLPVGEFTDNRYEFKQARAEAFSEGEVSDALMRSGVYPPLAHSYIGVIEPVKDTAPKGPGPVYTRFSNERREECQIRTDILVSKAPQGIVRRVKKSAMSKDAYAHIEHMAKSEKTLKDALSGVELFGKPLLINEITETEPGSATFAWVNGASLESLLDTMLAEGRENEVADLLLSVCKSLQQAPELRDFEESEEFVKIFGAIRENIDYGKSFPVTDIDMVCQNILLEETEKQTVLIDYEWTFDFPIPVDFLVFRFLYFYLEAKNRKAIERGVLAQLYEKVGLTEEKKEYFLSMETNLQHYVQEGAKVLCNEYDKNGKPMLTFEEISGQLKKLDGKCMQLDSEEDFLYPKRDKTGTMNFTISVEDSSRKLTLKSFSKLLRIGAMADVEGEHVGISYETNGLSIGGLLYLFEGVEPAITLKDIPSEGNVTGVSVSVEEIPMSEAALKELKTTVTDMRFIIDNREQQIADLKNSASWKVTKPLRALKGNKEE